MIERPGAPYANDVEGYPRAAVERMRELMQAQSDLVARVGLANGLGQAAFLAYVQGAAGAAPARRTEPASPKGNRRR